MKVPYIENNYGKITSHEIKLKKIAEQYSIREAHSGFILNIMLLGRRNLGTSTLVNSLFAAPLISKERSNNFTTTINELIEDEVKLRIITTTYHENDFNAVVKFINKRNEEYFVQEHGSYTDIDDRRVHVCLYIFPSDSMHEDEINGINLISTQCNLIPIISKADMYTSDELEKRRAELINLCQTNNIRIYDFERSGTMFDSNVPDNESKSFNGLSKTYGYDYEDEEQNQNQNNKNGDEEYVLATIASEKAYEIQGNVVRGRRYPWGFIDIDNEKYSDFKKLQIILLQNNYEDLLYRTDVVYYNNYRKNKFKESNEDYQQLMKKRLNILQIQLEKMLIKKHDMIMERLREEEKNIEDDLKLETEKALSVDNFINEIGIVETKEGIETETENKNENKNKTENLNENKILSS